MIRIDFNRKNYNRCLCGGCPVNRYSDCVQGQEKMIAGQFELIEKEEKMPDPKSMPGVYCAVGKSSCHDLDGKKSCLCPACPVVITEGLTNNYYCLKGSAEEVG